MEHTLQQVRRMMAIGRSFEHIEAFIESRVYLDDEERAVLWLIAWSGGQPSVVARELGRPRFYDDHDADFDRTRAHLTSFGS